MNDNVIVHVPIGILATMASEAGGAISLLSLSEKWSIIIQALDGYSIEGFSSQEECANRVAELHMNKECKVLYVLKDGVPRKNVKIEVKARFR
jgi:hypothetical protein